jgi:hypothetical protein
LKKFVAIAILTLLASATDLHAQTSISLYHLGNTIFQNNAVNPSWTPEGSFFVGLPVLSGIHVHANNKLSYNQAFSKTETGVLLDIDNAISHLQNQNMTSAHNKVSLLHLGLRLKNGVFVSFFANERIETDVLYSREIVEYGWRGNSAFLGDEVQFENVGTKATHFREIGFGLAASPNENLDVGLRAKYLIGFFDASTPHNFKARLTSSNDSFGLNAEWENAVLRTSGVDIYEGEDGQVNLSNHLIANGNTGFAIDLGATYKLSKDYSIAGSINDLGFISWKENITNYTLNDTVFTYNGVDLGEDINDLRQLLIDSLFDKFTVVETAEAYRAWLPMRMTGSWIYHYDEQTNVYASVSSRFIQRQVKMLYGVGITRQFGKTLTLSGSAIKMPQQFVNVGAAVAVKGGPAQLYLGVDQAINFSVPDARALDFRFGINFLFGENKNRVRKEKSTGSVTEPKGVDTNFFQGQPVRTKKREGVYSIIPKQKKRKVVTNKPREKKEVRRKSLLGLFGRKSPSGEKKKVTKKSLPPKRFDD